jgi:hypothetical protein
VSQGAPPREALRFLRVLVAGAVLVFGMGTAGSNLLPLLASEAARAGLGAIPYPLFWFHLGMGCLYLAAGMGIGRQRRWAPPMAWALAALHALSASVLWLWFFAGHPVEPRVLIMELLREGFWVLIGLYLWRAALPAAPHPR